MKHTLKTLAIIAAMLPFAVTSCEKPQTEEKNPQLSIVTEDATVPYTGDDVTVEFICSGDWTAELQFTGDDEWASITGNASGNGSGAVTVNVTENSGQEDRTATLTVTSGSLSDHFTIKQDGKKLNITQERIESVLQNGPMCAGHIGITIGLEKAELNLL